MRFGTIVLLFAGTAICFGCASVTGDTVQSIRVEARLADGTEIQDADCEVGNKFGVYRVKSPGSVTVRRSATDLQLTCRTDGQADARGVAVSRANAGMWGNIIIGGAVGAVIDHSNGAAYTYPQWIQLVFGRLLRFDRIDDSGGSPSLASDIGSVEPSVATRASETNAMKSAERRVVVVSGNAQASGSSAPATVRMITGKELIEHFSTLGTVFGKTDSGAEIRLNVKSDGNFDVRNLRPGGSSAIGTYSIHNDNDRICMVLNENAWRIMGDCYHLFDLGARKYAMRSVMNTYNFTYSTN